MDFATRCGILRLKNFFGVSEVFFINDLHSVGVIVWYDTQCGIFCFKVEKFSGGRAPPTIVLNEQRRS